MKEVQQMKHEKEKLAKENLDLRSYMDMEIESTAELEFNNGLINLRIDK